MPGNKFPVDELRDLARKAPAEHEDDPLCRLMTLCQLLHDHCVVEVARRSLVGHAPNEPPWLPYDLADGEDWPELPESLVPRVTLSGDLH